VNHYTCVRVCGRVYCLWYSVYIPQFLSLWCNAQCAAAWIWREEWRQDEDITTGKNKQRTTKIRNGLFTPACAVM